MTDSGPFWESLSYILVRGWIEFDQCFGICIEKNCLGIATGFVGLRP